MERQLGFFEEERSIAIEQDPEKTQEAKRSVRKLILGLPAGLRSPVLVNPLEMSVLQFSSLIRVKRMA